MIPAELLELLVCPKCKGPLQEDSPKQGLRCDECHLVYPVKDGIPVMLSDEAKTI